MIQNDVRNEMNAGREKGRGEKGTKRKKGKKKQNKESEGRNQIMIIKFRQRRIC